MKKFKKYIAVLCGSLTLGLGGCNDFLDIYDPAVVTPEYYNTKEGQEKLIVNLYARYRSVFTTYVLQYLGTDMYMSCDESPTAAQFNGYNADLSGLSGTIDSYWATLYKIVQESNILLNRCTPEIAGDDYDQMVAKGRILRSMAYYYLVETFGGVPLLTEENTSASNIITEVTRASEKDIYGFIVEELTQSLDKLPDVADAAGELSNTALKHFLGKIYLTRAYRDYAEPDDGTTAIRLFEEVIASTHYGLLDRFEECCCNETSSARLCRELGRCAGGNLVTMATIEPKLRDQILKRLMDILGSLVGCIISIPIIAITAIPLKLESPGPLFFKQKRVGRNGRVFYIHKLRSMYMDAEERKKELMAQNEMNGLMFKMQDDPRITKVGKFIRKTSIDELPQFFDVLRGDMSLVGTRPPTLDEYKQYESHHKRRLSMKPGITGLWQVSGRSDIEDFEDVVKLDVEYIDNWSLWGDIKILFKTVWVVFAGRGAK